MPIPDLKEYIHLMAEQVISNDLPPPSPLNIEQQFRVGNVLFDTVKGMGAVPNNQNVNYLGFTVFMRPTDFRRLCYADDRSQTARGIADAIKQGHPIGTPFLNLEVNIDDFDEGKPLNVYVRGHEGRGRADAFTIVNGSETLMPVNCFPIGLRARHLSPEFFEQLRKIGICKQGTKNNPLRVQLGEIFWNGQVL